MASAILELQKQATEANGDIISMLRRAHMIAYKLGLTQFDSWINAELSGYSETDTLPQYRHIRASVQVKVRGQSPIPVEFDEYMAEKFRVDRGIRDSISHLVSTLEECKTNYVEAKMPGVFCESICMSYGLPVMPCVWTYPTAVLRTIIEAVRKEVLDWALDLEKKGIRGENVSFTDDEKQLVQTTTNINVSDNATFIGGNVTESTICTISSDDTVPDKKAVLKAVTDLRSEIENGLQDPEERLQAESMLNNVETAADQEDSEKTKKWLGALMNFLSGVGAGTMSRIVGDFIGSLFGRNLGN